MTLALMVGLLGAAIPTQAASPGQAVWVDLLTEDAATAIDFYRQLLDWEIENKQVDPIWAPYLGVADLAATVTQAKELGGRVLLAPDPKLGEGRVALLADPTGGAFFIYELEEKTP